MKLTQKVSKYLPYAILVLLSITVIFLVYTGSIPDRYNLTAGMISDVDITAPRAVIDKAETEHRAEESRTKISPIYIRSEETSAESITALTEFFSVCNQVRIENVNEDGTLKKAYREVSNSLISQVETNFGFKLTDDQSFQIITSSQVNLDYVQTESVSIASLIMKDKVDDLDLKKRIESYAEGVETEGAYLYVSNDKLAYAILSGILRPNAVYDVEATNSARLAAYNEEINDPVMIEKGSRIVSYGDIISADTYETLKELDLIETTEFDYLLLVGISIYVAMVLALLGLYFKRYEPGVLDNTRDIAALVVSFVIPVLSSVYLSDFSNTISPVFFTAVIAATYLGAQSGIIFSILNMLVVLPMYGFDTEFILISIAGIFIASMIAGQRSRQYNSASLIFLTSLACAFASIGVNIVLKSSRTDMLQGLIWAIIAGSVSVIAAIGFMPIFELISNSVSPVRLIDLSQPGNPLLKRLFVEAPGTSQHSMMVANLADSAAEAIGANPLLAKVGAYYHDIGKLEKPLYYTENQQDGTNPHDLLPPEESAAIITAHPDQGVRLARRFRLPNAIIRIIQEHHGSTFQAYFYHKAKTQATEQGIPEPPMNAFRYRCSIPSTRESAVVMLADTCEAAIRSTGITSLDGAEELFRKLIKQKIDQDQLINSGLSFNDIEIIIRSFLQVYSGVFHERIKYPDDISIRK